jgi:hypothetical protein
LEVERTAHIIAAMKAHFKKEETAAYPQEELKKLKSELEHNKELTN